MDLNTLADAAASKAAEELDKALPDGFIQSGSAEALELVGLIITKLAEKLKTTENADGDS